MSTKDLIERLNRTAVRPTRTTTKRPATDAEVDEVQTRVNRRVIRRRRKGGEEVEAAATSAEAESKPVTRTVRRVAKPATADVPAAAEATAEETPAAAAPTPPVQDAAVAETAPVVADAKTAAATAPKKKKAPAKTAAAEKAPAAEADAPSAVAADAAPPEAAAKKAAAPEAATPAAASTDAAAPEAATPDAAPAAAASTEAAAPDTAAAAEAAPAAAASEPSAEGEEGPTPAASARRGLPRLGGDGAAMGTFPGLGSAVVAPPPGYDPSDPAGNRRRAQEAARRSTETDKPGTPGKPQWRDERTPGAAAPGRTDYKDKDRGGPRPKQRRRRRSSQNFMDDFGGMGRRRRNRKRSGPKKASPQAAAHKRRVEVDGTISVANLAYGMSVKASQVIKKLISMGQMATMNDELDLETAQLVAEEFEFEAVDGSFDEDAHMIDLEEEEEDEAQETRPPVVTIMGHVDHGKTTLLDTIRKANVADGEAGGITQHTSAYQVEKDGKLITFIDTPGHEAFTEMRARGAQVTDIVVLVVAADDGVMPQTVEALNHAKAAGVQIIVAVNKMDKPGANVDAIKQGLMAHELVPEEYGGETMFVPVSALTGDGIDNLLEALNLIAEVDEYTANPERHAIGTVLEARLEKGRGPVANVLVETGTLRQGDRVVMGTTWGRVRAMADFNGKRLKTAGPSSPVEIIGLQDVPSAGDNFVVVANDKAAKALAQNRLDDVARAVLAEKHTKAVTLEDLIRLQEEGEKLSLNLVVKSDVGGTLEALKASIGKVEVDGTEVKILHSAVGAISESDITLARTYGAVVFGFNVRPDSKARRAADGFGIEIRTYRVIYEALEDIEKALKGMLGPTFEEKVQGVAEIRETFTVPKIGTIAGCRVMEGTISRNHSVRLLRDGTIVWTGRLASLRRFKDDVREVGEGYECGMNLDGFNDIKPGDQIEAFSQEEVVED